MRSHLSLRSGNPVLTKETFNTLSSSSGQMTIEGTVNKTALSLFLLILVLIISGEVVIK